MCFGGGGNKEAAAARQEAAADRERMRQEEEQRKASIKAGQEQIDTAFSRFDDKYYGDYQKTVTDFYNPQIADQYAKARDKLVATLAGRGTLDSTVGAAKLADLDKTRADAEADIGNQAVDAANTVKKQVETNKSNLYSLNQGVADPSAISARAIGEATSIATPQALSPLGQVFANVLNSAAVFNKADSTSMNPRLPWNRSSSVGPSGRGSVIYGG